MKGIHLHGPASVLVTVVQKNVDPMQTVEQQTKVSHVPASLASRVMATQVVTCPLCANPPLIALKTRLVSLGPVSAQLASILCPTFAWTRTSAASTLIYVVTTLTAST